MKAQANRYSLSVAPTGRARGRVCKGLVARGEVRLVTLTVVSERPRRVTKFVRHATCVRCGIGKRKACAARAWDGRERACQWWGYVSAEMVGGVRATLQRLTNV